MFAGDVDGDAQVGMDELILDLGGLGEERFDGGDGFEGGGVGGESVAQDGGFVFEVVEPAEAVDFEFLGHHGLVEDFGQIGREVTRGAGHVDVGGFGVGAGGDG